MSEVRMTANEARAAAQADWNKIDATTEADMRRHALEDGEDLDDDQPFVMRNAPRARSIDEISDVEADRIGSRRRALPWRWLPDRQLGSRTWCEAERRL